MRASATRRILEREFRAYGKAEFERLAAISMVSCTTCAANPRYRQGRTKYEKTRPTPVAIGERRRPDPMGQPGYLRVDTVHQGDTENAKGVDPIHAVDDSTQWEIAASVERISEAYLEPVLVTLLAQFLFVVHGFHSDNGSEFINQTVAKLLNKLMIQQTRVARDIPTTMSWRKPTMAPSSANIWAGAIFQPPLPTASSSSTAPT
jgi:hypothetical protein